MKKALGLMYVVIGAALTACGHSDSTPSTQTSGVNSPGNSAYVGGACGDQVVQDYRHFEDICGLKDSRRGRVDDQCRGVADDFLHKYPAVSCDLPKEGPGAIRARRIEARDIQVYSSNNTVR